MRRQWASYSALYRFGRLPVTFLVHRLSNVFARCTWVREWVTVRWLAGESTMLSAEWSDWVRWGPIWSGGVISHTGLKHAGTPPGQYNRQRRQDQGFYGQGKSGKVREFWGVRESQGKQIGSGKSQGILKYQTNCCYQMSDFKAKMHQIRFRLGLHPRPRWGSLQCSPRSPSWI